MLKSRDIRVSRIARGVPVGGELEYVDPGTLAQAVRERKSLADYAVWPLSAILTEGGFVYNPPLMFPTSISSFWRVSTMSSEGKSEDCGRRRLIVATAAVGGAGAVTALVPFVSSMLPSERASAAGAPVEVSCGESGPRSDDYRRVAWQAGLDF